MEELAVEQDGRSPLRRGGTPSWLRSFDDPEQVQILSPLVVGAARTPELLEALNELNAGFRFVRIFVTADGDVLLVVDLPGPDVRAEDLEFALGVHGHLADTLDLDLQARFGGGSPPSDRTGDAVSV